MTSTKQARRESFKAHYDKNPTSVRTRIYKRRAEHRTKIEAIKSAPCMDCGLLYPFICMDFDHVRGEKVANVSYLVNQGYAWEVVEMEIAKCDLVCANCHRIRTYERGEYRKAV